MPRVSSVWECQNCGAQFPKWAGRCPDCGQWNTLVETAVSTKFKVQSSKFKVAAQSAKPQKLSEILKAQDKSVQRITTGIGELDRVLGGGLVPGQVALLAGEPGMGKSTLLSQVALVFTKANILYVCGEESPSQVGLRLRRLYEGPALPRQGRAVSDAITLFPQTDVDAVIAEILRSARSDAVSAVIIDSIQTMATADLSGLAGAVGQIRESAARLSATAKSLNIPLFLVGHVTKEGEVAGPKVLEHMVDTVLVMEGDRSGNLRILRSLKNRFGPVDEVGIFSMAEGGMAEVKNPAELLIGDLAGKSAGSVLGCVMEGLRPLVLEVQALAVPTKLSFPRRVGAGISERRLQLLCAVVEKHLGLGIGEKDVFVNVAGGLKSSDPGLDLPVVVAIVSSAAQKSQLKSAEIGRHQIADKSEEVGSDFSDLSAIRLSADASRSKPTFPIFCGEVGLLGEIRMVPGWDRRQKEVQRLGMGKLVGKPDIGHIRELQKYLVK